MRRFKREDFEIKNLGPSFFASPLQPRRDEANANFVCDDRHRVLFDHAFERVAAN